MRETDEGKGSTTTSAGSDTSHRVEEKAQEKYWDISSRGLTRILRNSTLPFGETVNQATDISGAAYTAGRRLDREESLRVDTETIVIVDSSGRKVMHEAALEDLDALELEMLEIGSYFINKYEATSTDEREIAAIDRGAVIYDIFNAEVWFNIEKRDLLDIYLHIYEQTTDLLERQELAQRIIDVIAIRPKLDLQESYFVEAYSASICLLRSRLVLLQQLFAYQVVTELTETRKVAAAAKTDLFDQKEQSDSKDERGASKSSRRVSNRVTLHGLSATGRGGEEYGDGLAHPREGTTLSGGTISADPRASGRGGEEQAEKVDSQHLCGTACMAWKAELILQEVHKELVQRYNPPSPVVSTQLERACYVTALERWKVFDDEKAAAAKKPQYDAKDDVDLQLKLIYALARKLSSEGTGEAQDGNAATQEEKKEKPKQDDLDVDDLQPEVDTLQPKRAASPAQALNAGAVGAPLSFVASAFAKENIFDTARNAAFESYIENLQVDEVMRVVFADVTLSAEELKHAGTGAAAGTTAAFLQVAGVLLAHALEAVHLRFRLQDVNHEVAHLDLVLRQQATDFGTSMTDLEPSLAKSELTASYVQVQGDLVKSVLDFSSGNALATSIASHTLQELRRLLQHEVAFRGLSLACAQQNALLLDPQIRARETQEIGVMGLSRETLSADGGLHVMRRLRESLEVSGFDKDHLHCRMPASDASQDAATGRAGFGEASGEEVREGQKSQIVMDMSRYAQYLQQPSRYMQSVLEALRPLYKDRMMEPLLDSRQQRKLEFDLLRCSSLLALRFACDLAIGLQASQAALELMTAATLLPLPLTPFTYGDRRKPLVERDGLLGNIFSIPTVFDVLQLKALQPIPDMSVFLDAALAAVDTGSAPKIPSQLKTRRFLSISDSGRLLDDLSAFSRPDFDLEARSSQIFDISYTGPAFTVLRLLQGLAQLVMLRYAICAVEGDPVSLLEAQRTARFSLSEPDALFKKEKEPEVEAGAEGEANEPTSTTGKSKNATGAVGGGQQASGDGEGDVIGTSEPSFEALEELCQDLGRLGLRLDSLGAEACRKPAKVLAVLDSELRSAHRQLAVLLRWATRGLIQEEKGQSEEAMALRLWSGYLEEGLHPKARARPWLLHLLPAEKQRRSLHPFACMTVPSMKVGLQSWDREPYSGGVQATLSPRPPLHAVGELPETTHHDGHRFLAIYHPTLLRPQRGLHPLVQILQGRFAGAVPYKDESFPSAEKDVDPFFGRLPWMQPHGQLAALLSFPLGLCPERRQQLSSARAAMAERRRAMLLLHKLDGNSDRAVDAEAEFYGVWLLRERLQEVVVAGQLGLSGMPTEGPTLARIQAQLAASCPPEEPALPSATHGPAVGELSEEAVSTELNSIREQLKALVPALSRVIVSLATEELRSEFSALVSLRFRMKAAKSSMGLSRKTAVEQTSAKVASSRSARLSTGHDHKPVVLMTRGPYASRLDGVLRPFNHLKTKSTYVRMNNDENGEKAHILKEIDINVFLEDLVAGLESWGRNMASTRERRAAEMEGFLKHQQEALRSRIARVEADTLEEGHFLDTQSGAPLQLESMEEMELLQKKKDMMEAKFRTEVAARSCQLVFEVDRLHRALRTLKATSQGLQSRLEGEVMQEVRSMISSFTGALAAEAGRFRERHQDDAKKLATQIRALREHVTSEFAGLAAKNQASQMKAVQPRQVKGLETLLSDKDKEGGASDAFPGGGLASEAEPLSPTSELLDEQEPLERRGRRNSTIDAAAAKQAVKVLTVSDGMYEKLADVTSRDDLFILHMKLKELKDRQVLLRMFHHFKCQAMRQRFEDQAEALYATLESNSQLLQQLSEVSQTEMALASQFVETAEDVATEEKRADDLRTAEDSNTEQRRRLLKWKKHKIKQLFHMKKGVREHQLAGTVDVASLLHAIQEKQELVTVLEQQREESFEQVGAASKKSKEITDRVKKALTDQRRVKENTYEQLQQLREEMQIGPVDESKRLDMWRSRLVEAKTKLSELEEENMRLRILNSMNRSTTPAGNSQHSQPST